MTTDKEPTERVEVTVDDNIAASDIMGLIERTVPFPHAARVPYSEIARICARHRHRHQSAPTAGEPTERARELLAETMSVKHHRGPGVSERVVAGVRSGTSDNRAVTIKVAIRAITRALASAPTIPADPSLAPLVAELEGLLERAPKGPWEADAEHDDDAEYGSGPDPERGYSNFIVFDGIGQLLFGTATSDAKCIVEEPYGDEDGYKQAWDETGKATVDLIVAVVNALPALLAAIKERQHG